MKLTDLSPQFLKWISPNEFRQVDSISEADCIDFLCPKCYLANGNSAIGTHHCCCWQPHIGQHTSPMPGRWKFHGTGYNDLTLVAGSSSVLLKGGCKAHFYIKNGQIIMA